jgi:hypothetical protein
VNFLQHIRKVLIPLFLVFVLSTTAACGTAVKTDRVADQPQLNTTTSYSQLERGDTRVGQDFGNWVVQTAKGLVQDAYVRDNDKLGVVISPQVRPNEVRSLARSLAQGFHHNFPNRDLTVFMYAPDKKLIMKAQYNNATNQVEYQLAS